MTTSPSLTKGGGLKGEGYLIKKLLHTKGGCDESVGLVYCRVNGWIIIALILTAVGVIPAAPFSRFADVAWAVLTVPVLVLGILVIKRA